MMCKEARHALYLLVKVAQNGEFGYCMVYDATNKQANYGVIGSPVTLNLAEAMELTLQGIHVVE